jgi:uncharacterized protein HemX
MHISTKALLAALTLGGVGYAIHRRHRKKQAEESRKRRLSKQQEKAA